MKKSKIITVVLLMVILATVSMAALVACDKTHTHNWSSEYIEDGEQHYQTCDGCEEKKYSNHDFTYGDCVCGKEYTEDPSDDPNKPSVKPPSGKLDPMGFLNKIVESIDSPDDVLNLNITATLDSKKDFIYVISLKGNLYELMDKTTEDGEPIAPTKGKNELAFTIHTQSKSQSQAKELVFAMYIIDEKMYIDLADGSPLLYLSDFDANYLLQIIKGAGGMLGDLLEGLDPTILKLIPQVLNLFVFAKPVTTVNADKSVDISMEVKINYLLGAVDKVLGALGLDLPVDIAPIIKYLQTLIPSDESFFLKAHFAADGALNTVGFDGIRKDPDSGFTLQAEIEITDKASADIGVPSESDIEVTDFSFTNIQFAIDLKVASSLDESGSEMPLDVGKLINGFLPTANIPEGLLLIKGGTGLRLSFKLDLDLDYDKKGTDKNKMAIELFLLDPRTGRPVEVSPQMGIYYIDGSFYLNTDNMLPNYLNGLNIKLDASLAELMDMLVSLVTDAIDKAFGISFDEIRNKGAKLNDNGSISIPSSSVLSSVLRSSSASVVALAAEDNGEYKLSAGIANLVNAVAAVLGLAGTKDEDGNFETPPNVYTDDTSIKVVVNNEFFRILGGLIPALSTIKLPSQIGDIVLSINTFKGGIESITVSTTVNNVTTELKDKETITVITPALNVELAIGNFFICFEDDGLGDYINTKVDKENTNYLSSLNGVIEHMLGGIRFSSGFNMVFDKGTYDLAPFIAGFGVKEVENSHILWEFTDKFILDASLNLQIALNRTDTAKSMIVLELKTESGIKVGEGDNWIIKPGQVLFGIYGYNNNIYIDISNFNIAGIVLPKLSFSLNFTDLIYTLLDDVVSKLLAQINVTGGDLKFELNFKDLFGIGKSDIAGKGEDGAVAQNALAGGGASYASSAIDPSAALVLIFNTEKIQPVLSLATILAILSATGTDLGNTLSEALSLMELDLSIDMDRNEGFKFSFAGEFIPKLDENGEAVYYFDKDNNKIKVEEGKIYRHISEKPQDEKDDPNSKIVYYTTKKYNYGSNLKLVFEAGTENFPIIVGNLGEHKYPIEDKVEYFEEFKSDLIQAIVDTVGKAAISLDIDLNTLDNQMNITKLINTILANMGKKLDLPISLDLDDWNAHVQLLLSWDLDLTKFSNSKIMLELKFEEKNILGLYINRNSIIVDLTGLGLFSGEIVNSSIVTKVFKMIDGVIKNIGDLDLNKIINDLLKNAGLPTVGTKPEGGQSESTAGGDVATDGDVPTIGEGLQINDFISYLTQAIRLEDTAIVIDFTSSLINGMLTELVGLNLGMNLGVNGRFDLFGDSLDLGIKVEDIEMDAKLSLSVGKDVTIPVNFDEVPDWDATSGKTFATTLLNNLDIGFTIDLANYTNDTVDLQNTLGGTDNYKMFTRIIIEKITNPAGKKLTGTAHSVTAPEGSFLITLAHINRAMYDDNQSASASAKPMVYIVLDHRKASGQLQVVLCSNLISVLGIDIGDKINPINADLDLVGMLAPMIDDLLKSIDGAIDGMGEQLTGGAQSASQDAPMALAGDQPSEPTGIEKVFADLDIIKLLGKDGIMLNLRANGTFNVTIEFDPYIINKLIDDIMGWVFAKGTGHTSLINLAEMAPDMFKQDYLSMITWTREEYGADKKRNTLWGDLMDVLPDLAKDALRSIIGGFADMIADGTIQGIASQLRPIISGLLPFAVWNTATLEVNIVDATIANIHFKGQDTWEHIYIDNDPSKDIAYDKNKDARGGPQTNGKELFYTEIFIYNSSKSVGEYPANGTDKGLVTWADIPTNITFMPYIYSSVKDGVEEIIDTHFTKKVAIYQRGTTIMRADVEFKIVSGQFRDDMTVNNLLSKLSTAGDYQVEATARFSNGTVRRLMIDIEARDEGGGLDYIEPIEMHAYDDALPDFVTVYTKDGKSRKINTRYLTVTGWRPNTFEEHDVTAQVSFKNGTTLPMDIHYLDSTVTTIIINGVEGKNVNVDLYEFNLGTSKVDDYTPQTLYFKYKDGKAVGLDVLNGWIVSDADNLFNRPLNVNGTYSNVVNGYEFSIRTNIAAFDGRAQQEVELVFTVKTKNVEKMTINGEVNNINIDPYEYYMYKIGESEKNPFPSTAVADYYDVYKSYDGTKDIIDTYSEEVNIAWKNIDGIDFTWNTNGSNINRDAKIVLDNSAYPNGSFTWEFPTQVSVLRNEVEAVYFDEALSQATYYIDPFQYIINGKGTDNFAKYAYVKFTNGAVYRMPIAWRGLEDFKINPAKPAQFRQFDIVIGFDVDEFNRTGNIVPYTGIKGNLLQETFVNVQVENRVPKGLRIDGSQLMGGTYYIDPVQVLYYGMTPFPNKVTVEYMSGKTSVLEVNDSLWIRDFDITMKGKKGLKATLQLNDEYSFDLDVEIINRSDLKAELTDMSIDPYVYKTDDRGNRIYDSYVDNFNLYQTVGTFDAKTFEITGAHRASMGEFAENVTGFRYKLVYTKDGKTETVVEEDIDYIKDFINKNQDIIIVSTEVIEYFNVPIAWDLNEINYSKADTYTVKAIVQAANAQFNKIYKVNVTVMAKKVVGIGGGVQYIMVGGTNLSDAAKQTKLLTLNKQVMFDDGTSGTYECTIDLSGIQFDSVTSATLRWSTDANGNLVITDLRNQGAVITTEEEVRACAMDVKITVCSGDIAQETTVKVHVLDNQA